MAKLQRISNYALIDNVEISFENGMTSITGETGAGKSILLGGLSLVLGSRVDNTKIINKDKKCFVEATFDLNGQNLEVFFLLSHVPIVASPQTFAIYYYYALCSIALFYRIVGNIENSHQSLTNSFVH